MPKQPNPADKISNYVMGAIRSYLKRRYRAGEPASYHDFKQKHPRSKISAETYNAATRAWIVNMMAKPPSVEIRAMIQWAVTQCSEAEETDPAATFQKESEIPNDNGKEKESAILTNEAKTEGNPPEQPINMKAQAQAYLEERYIENKPASHPNFLARKGYTSEQCSSSTFGGAVAGWKKNIERTGTKEEAVKRRIWFRGKRLDKPLSMAASVWAYLDECCTKDQPASREDFLATNNLSDQEVPINAYNSAARRWGKSIAQIANRVEAQKRTTWFAGKRLERPPSIIANIREYFRDCVELNLPMSYEEFLIQYHYNAAQVLQETYKRTIMAIKNNSPGEIGSPEISAEMEVSENIEESSEKTSATSVRELVWQFLDEQYKNHAPAGVRDFRRQYPTIAITTNDYNNAVFRWVARATLVGEAEKIYWNNKIRIKSLVRDVKAFCEDCYGRDQPALYEEFLPTYGYSSEVVSKERYAHAMQHWADEIPRRAASDSAEIAKRQTWWDEMRLHPPSQKVLQYIEECYQTKSVPTYEDCGERKGHVAYGVYRAAKKQWRAEAEEAPDREERVQWFRTKGSYGNKIAVKVGNLFEQITVAVIYKALEERNIQLFHQVVDHTVKRASTRLSSGQNKHVEIRILTKDLLGNMSKIGPALRRFLEKNPQPELAIDITISQVYGRKIGKYANGITNLIIATTKSARGQRRLEPNVRVISITELLSRDWLNLELGEIAEIKRALALVRAAVRGTTNSKAFKDLQDQVEKIWAGVMGKIEHTSSQERYKTRVIQEVIAQLKEGVWSKELAAIIASERIAGREQSATQLEGLAQAILGMGIALRKKANEKKRSQEQNAGANQNSREKQIWGNYHAQVAVASAARRQRTPEEVEEELAWAEYYRQLAVSTANGNPGEIPQFG